MIFNKHYALADKHAFLSPSNYHWLNYDEEKLQDRFLTAMAAQRGTELHAFAQQAIYLGVKLPDNGQTLSSFVNDAIGYRMESEQTLFYSENCFGTADAICFRNNFLRIHDLKTGVTKTSPLQLEVYAALFCLEYGFKPFDIEMELRIYQNDEVRIYIPEPGDIAHHMSTIISFDKKINELRSTL